MSAIGESILCGQISALIVLLWFAVHHLGRIAHTEETTFAKVLEKRLAKEPWQEECDE